MESLNFIESISPFISDPYSKLNSPNYVKITNFTQDSDLQMLHFTFSRTFYPGQNLSLSIYYRSSYSDDDFGLFKREYKDNGIVRLL